MKRTGRNGGRGDYPGQFHIEWSAVTDQRPVTATPPPTNSRSEINVSDDRPAVQPLVQYLPWDFETTFPEPLPQAIEAGILEDDDIDTVRWIHLEHAKEALAVLHELDAVLDARRRGVNPETGKPPRTPASSERLRKFFETEPGRLEHWYQTLMDTYAEAFGDEAADAFNKALRARHAGIPVTAERDRLPVSQPAETAEEPPVQFHVQKLARTEHRRAVARFPVPTPLASAVAAGRFGHEENGRPVRPGPHEVREITRRHAEKLIDILDSIAQAAGSCVPGEANRLQGLFDSALAAYAEDFGRHVADQLEAYVRRQAALDASERRER
jgi:hypothetical protein